MQNNNNIAKMHPVTLLTVVSKRLCCKDFSETDKIWMTDFFPLIHKDHGFCSYKSKSWKRGKKIIKSMLIKVVSLCNLYTVEHEPEINFFGTNWLLDLQAIRGHFRVPPGLCIKTRLSAQPLIWKWFFILMQIKLIFTRKVVHLASLRK